MDIRNNYARLQEDQLLDEISGLDEKLANLDGPSDPDTRCVASYLRQLLKRKRNRLATLQYRREPAKR